MFREKFGASIDAGCYYSALVTRESLQFALDGADRVYSGLSLLMRGGRIAECLVVGESCYLSTPLTSQRLVDANGVGIASGSGRRLGGDGT